MLCERQDNRKLTVSRVRYVSLVIHYVYRWSEGGGEGKRDGEGNGSEKEYLWMTLLF